MKTILALLAAALSTTLFVQPSVSQKPATYDTVVDNTRSVSYLGLKNEMLVFEVSLNFDDNETRILKIYDENSIEIYSERIKTNTFVKQYMFAKNAGAKIQFTLRGKKTILNETFEVNYKIEEKLVITKA